MVNTKNTKCRPVALISGVNQGVRSEIRRSQEDFYEALGDQEYERLLSISVTNGKLV
jgi:hypothetical protein